MSKKNILLISILALILIIVSYMDLHIIVSRWMPFVISLGGVILMCSLIAINVKKDNDGYASFGVLIKYFAITILITTVLNAVFSVAYLSMMDETQKHSLIDIKIEKIYERNRDNEMNQKELASLDNTLEGSVSNNYKLSSQMINIIPSFLVFFLISFIPAILFKKNPKNM